MQFTVNINELTKAQREHFCAFILGYPTANADASYSVVARETDEVESMSVELSGSGEAAIMVNGVEVDAKGLPWDHRIHVESKAKLKDGSWRLKKQMDPATVSAVEAELRQVMAAPAPSSIFTQAVAEVPPPPPPPAAPEIGTSVNDFIALIGQCATAAVDTAKKAQIDAIVGAALGTPGATVNLLSSRLDLIPAVHAQLKAAGVI